ncbi:MAG: HAMP domain-containing protein [Bryobacterales bacterium]|nr:HAMP domain-containing protein [Bryobacterales bacterium]MBV9397477.1 HAMP domain-containing protein [Bryobacterales bacterium]
MKSPFRLRPVSLLWKILFSTSIAITALFAAMGWILQNQFARIAELSLDEEAQTSFHAYESLWNARADQLASESRVMSKTPQIRAAFGTRDKATIKDVALETWDAFAHPGALLMVADPGGTVLVKAGADDLYSADFVRSAVNKFPKQARGFVSGGGRLYQIVVTPVYVAAGRGDALLNVLVAGTAVDADLALKLKEATGGSEFLFFTHGRLVASTLHPAAERELEAQGIASAGQQTRVAGAKYYQFASPLADVDGHPVGELRILRSFDAADKRISEMRARLVVLWIGAMIAGLALTYLLARRLLQPVAALDRAAAEIAKGNYEVKVPVETGYEIGRLGQTFNAMCASIRHGRDELIRHERIATIGRLSTSIIHDLRNPLAAIYGGAEILVDSDLSAVQVRRLAQNIYRSSRKVQDLLQELADVTEGRAHAREICRLREIVCAAYEPLAAAAQAQHVSVRIEVPEQVELPLDRSPMERVFQNLIGNAIEAMPEGGDVRVSASRQDSQVLVSVEDTGPGVPATIASQLFQPFVTAGKKNGMGLGLALSRKTVLSHGGDLWTEETLSGARFVMKLPV